jgi:hypothetical protein
MFIELLTVQSFSRMTYSPMALRSGGLSGSRFTGRGIETLRQVSCDRGFEFETSLRENLKNQLQHPKIGLQ